MTADSVGVPTSMHDFRKFGPACTVDTYTVMYVNFHKEACASLTKFSYPMLMAICWLVPRLF